MTVQRKIADILADNESISDIELAELAGCTRRFAGLCRQRLGIPPLRERIKERSKQKHKNTVCFISGKGTLICPDHPRYTGKYPPPYECLFCTELFNYQQMKNEIQLLRTQINDVCGLNRKITQDIYTDDYIRFGLIGDTHLGSLWCNHELLEIAYDTFQKEGIGSVYHCGDLCDGEKMFRGHEYEIAIHGADAQIEYAKNTYPFRNGITTKVIAGNHDLSFYKHGGTDIIKKLADERDDIEYLGMDQATVNLVASNGGIVKLQLSHPGDGTAYALSYKPQKHIESLSGGHKPHIVGIGHYHKALCMPDYRNVNGIMCGTTQRQTQFMKRKNLAAHMGFWIIEAKVSEENLISRFRCEFFADYS